MIIVELWTPIVLNGNSNCSVKILSTFIYLKKAMKYIEENGYELHDSGTNHMTDHDSRPRGITIFVRKVRKDGI